MMDRTLRYLCPIQDILDTNINLDGAVALAWKLILVGYKVLWDRPIMPFVSGALHFKVIRNRPTELDFRAVNKSTPEKIIIAHPLKQVLQMAFVRLKNFVHYRALKQQIR